MRSAPTSRVLNDLREAVFRANPNFQPTELSRLSDTQRQALREYETERCRSDQTNAHLDYNGLPPSHLLTAPRRLAAWNWFSGAATHPSRRGAPSLLPKRQPPLPTRVNLTLASLSG